MRYIILTKTDRAKLNRFKTELIRLKKIDTELYTRNMGNVLTDENKEEYLLLWDLIDNTERAIQDIKNVRGIGKKIRKPTINASWEPIPKNYTGKNIKKAFCYATIEFTNNGWRFI